MIANPLFEGVCGREVVRAVVAADGGWDFVSAWGGGGLVVVVGGVWGGG